MSKVIIILNKRAGVLFRPFRRHSPQAVRKAFNAAGIDPEIHETTPRDLVKTLHLAMEQEPGTIVVAGGDGTINTAATVLGGSDIALAVLPRGTFNIFSRHMGLPFNVNKIARMVAAGHSSLLEVGLVNNRVFTLFSSIGVYPQFVRERKFLQHRRGWWKPFAMFWALAKSFVRFPRLILNVDVEGERQTLQTTSVIITTTPGALSPIMLRKDGAHYLRDRVLHLYMGRHATRRQMLVSFLKILMRGPKLDKEFTEQPITSVTVNVQGRRRRVLAACDGELFHLRAPLRYRIEVEHLRVVLPEEVVEAGKDAGKD